MYQIKLIEPKYDKGIEKVCRDCLIEFNCNKEGFAWADPYLCCLSSVYNNIDSAYFVLVDENDVVYGGCGIAKLLGKENICELQKMYCVKSIRGSNYTHKLMKTALNFAKDHYEYCYIETVNQMVAANKFYLHYGFIKLDKPLGNTGHFNCDVSYLKKL